MTEELKIDSIPPGLVVVSKIELHGGIHYERDYLDEYFEDEVRKVKEWNTKSTIDDVDERSLALKTISTMRRNISSLCGNTKVGLICQKTKEKELYERINSIREEADQFNQSAKTCRILPWFAVLQVKEDNTEVIAAIASQVAEICTRVDEALSVSDLEALRRTPKRFLKGVRPETILALDDVERDAVVARSRAELIRTAIAEAKGIEKLLPIEASLEVKDAISRSRKIARELCNRVEKKQEDLSSFLNEVDVSGIRRTRTAFVKAASIAIEKTKEKCRANQYSPTRKAQTFVESTLQNTKDQLVDTV